MSYKTIAATCSCVLGRAAYWFILGRHQELDLQAPKLCLIYVILAIGMALPTFAISDSYAEAILTMSMIWICHALGIFIPIVLYRTSLSGEHPLVSFKGPWQARLSHSYVVLLTIVGWHLYEKLQKLHDQYGDYVRIGPNTLSIIDPRAIKAIHGPQSRCFKGPMYDIAHPRHTLHFCREKQEHATRRRVWRRGLDTTSITFYRTRIADCTKQLLDLISQSHGKPVNAAKYLNLFSFDAMGLVGFGHSFDRLEQGATNSYMENLHKNTLMAGTFSHMPWIIQILKQIPFFNWQYTSFIAQSQCMAEKRIEHVSSEPSIFAPIVAAFRQQPRQTMQEYHNLYGDADLIVVAGSDTIAAVLTAATFCLAEHPEHIAKVRSLREHSKDDASKYIDAIILETLRLHPVISSGLQRVTPPEGLQICADIFIPGHTRVQTPSYVMFRDERLFAYPNTFSPSRFTSEGTHLVKDMSAFVPFNTGVYSCIGRQLAMMELNMVLTEVIDRFDIRLAPGQTEAKFMESKRDTFTLFIRDLQIIFAPCVGSDPPKA